MVAVAVVLAAAVAVAVAEAVAVNAFVLPAGTAGGADSAIPEVRPAQAAGVSAAVQTERPAMSLPAPPPIRF